MLGGVADRVAEWKLSKAITPELLHKTQCKVAQSESYKARIISNRTECDRSRKVDD
jgi:hypothetical protein